MMRSKVTFCAAAVTLAGLNAIPAQPDSNTTAAPVIPVTAGQAIHVDAGFR
jgi:hypothetical protein